MAKSGNLLIGCALGALALTHAGAALADRPPSLKDRAPVSVLSWTGFYAGVNVGYGWSASGITIGDTEDSPVGPEPEGVFGGGQMGYNWQRGSLVLGVEVDMQASGIRDTTHDTNFGDVATSKLNWFGTVRGRLGYAFDRALVYATGGFAYGGVENQLSGPLLVGSPYRFDSTATGYVVGGGLDYKISQSMSLRAEYLYINLDTNVAKNPAGTPVTNLTNDVVKDNDYHTVRFGLNYHFNSGR